MSREGSEGVRTRGSTAKAPALLGSVGALPLWRWGWACDASAAQVGLEAQRPMRPGLTRLMRPRLHRPVG